MTESFDAPQSNVAPGGAPVPNAPSPDNAFDAPTVIRTKRDGGGAMQLPAAALTCPQGGERCAFCDAGAKLSH